MSTKSATVRMTGETPLLMHAFPMVPIDGFDKLPPEEQAAHAAYKTPDGAYYIPGVNIQRALIAAAAFSKGKGRASLQKQAAACLFVSPQRVLLPDGEYEIDSRPVVIPSTKGRILRHRPRFDEWSIEFELSWDDTLLSAKEARTVVDDMGQRVGLLDFRPEKKGPFGRCVVTHWEPRKE